MNTIASKSIFDTERLYVRELCSSDFEQFHSLLSTPAIIELIPQAAPSPEDIASRFEQFIKTGSPNNRDTNRVWAICEQEHIETIGLCAILINNDGDPEIGYRLLPEYWGQGYATEIAGKLIDYSFNTYNYPKITADVWEENQASIRILEKYFVEYKRFYNQVDQCWDRRYTLNRRNK